MNEISNSWNYRMLLHWITKLQVKKSIDWTLSLFFWSAMTSHPEGCKLLDDSLRLKVKTCNLVLTIICSPVNKKRFQRGVRVCCSVSDAIDTQCSCDEHCDNAEESGGLDPCNKMCTVSWDKVNSVCSLLQSRIKKTHGNTQYVRATHDPYNLSCTAPLRCQQCKKQQPLLWSLTPRKLRLDSHDVLCERARLVGAQHVHSSEFLGGCQPRHNGLSVCQILKTWSRWSHDWFR